MKTLLTFLLTLSELFTFEQVKGDTTHLKHLAASYVTKMYMNKQYDSASLMWDKNMYFEMGDFYKKREQGQLKDAMLYKRVKSDVEKYLKQLDKFTLDKFLASSIAEENGTLYGQVFFEYTEVLGGKPKKAKTMLVFISKDKGDTWIIQDWKIKDVADKVSKNLI